MRNRLSGIVGVALLVVVAAGGAGCQRKPREYAGITPQKGSEAAQTDAAKVSPSAHYTDSKLIDPATGR